MGGRFTFKDFVLLTGILILLAVLLLVMYMIDRQWQKMAQMQALMEEQAMDIRGLRQTYGQLEQRMASGDFKTSSSDSTSTDGISAAFKRAYAMTQQPDYAEGDWLISAFNTGLKTITPLVSSDAYASEVQSYVLESLLIRNPDTLEWEGLIARSWQVSDDGLVITFQLRDDVAFSDGKPVTADDVVFTFNFIMNESIAAPRQRSYLEKIKSVTATNPHEVVFTFSEPYFESLSLAGGLSIMAQHFYESYLDKPEEFNQSKGLLLGSGPYRLVDPKGWTPDKGFVELQRNPRYWGDVQPSFNRIIWRVIENETAELTAFRNGEIDSYNARPIEYKNLKNDEQIKKNSNNYEYMSPIVGYSYIGWNQSRKGKPTWFADKRVRQAMTYLTDRKRIIDEIMLGYGEVAISPFNPRTAQHNPALKPREYALEKAKALLDEAGFKDSDGDGVLEDSEGKPFEFELVVFQDNKDSNRTVLLLKDLYARAGIKLIPKPTEWSVMLDLLDKKDFDAITLGWTSGLETDIYQMFHSSQTKAGGDNFIGYKNPELDELIDKARATVDEEKRMPLWQKAEAIMFEDQPYTFLMRRKRLAFIDKRIKNLQMTKLGLNQLLPIEWYVPLALQKHHE
ncbi:MAG TPA: ABC transporter substrate-binding protein [Chromatiales bacterium]|nr:ABC transporter substrate-binding protein [Thiotrichales bacterium]HIP68333.1 ABC transporter substrate-binding protein [Chromatiales bacterium]